MIKLLTLIALGFLLNGIAQSDSILWKYTEKMFNAQFYSFSIKKDSYRNALYLNFASKFFKPQINTDFHRL